MKRHAAVGGSFDHFHAGHQMLLRKASSGPEELTIGITHPVMLAGKKFAASIEPLYVRKKSVEDYMTQIDRKSHHTIIVLRDIYGNTVEDPILRVLYVTENTYENGVRVNAARKSRGLPELQLEIIPLLKGPDGNVISSTRIRAGEIDRAGNRYDFLLKSRPIFRVNDSIRKELRKPFGELYPGNENDYLQAGKLVVASLRKEQPIFVICVGDIVTGTLQQCGFEPNMSIIDFRTRRVYRPELLHSAVHRLGPVHNSAGTLSQEAGLLVAETIRLAAETMQHHQIIIHGEEDLLALPAIMLAPLGSAVLYGQFDQGIVVTRVTEEIKAKARTILEGFQE